MTTLKEELMKLRSKKLGEWNEEREEKELVEKVFDAVIGLYYKEEINKNPSIKVCKVSILDMEPHNILIFDYQESKFVRPEWATVTMFPKQYEALKKHGEAVCGLKVYPLKEKSESVCEGEQYIFELELDDEQEEAGG